MIGVIKNEGISTTSGRYYLTDMEGNVLCEQEVYSLRGNEQIVKSFDINWDDVRKDKLDLRAWLECNDDELYDYNNRDTIHLTSIKHVKTENPDMVLPEMLKTVDEEAFLGARFRSVELPEGMTKIGARAFKNCSRLEQIMIPASVTVIAEDAFEGVSGFVIFCPEGSAAEAYAKAHNIICVTE